jgi:NADH:ubiquinone reductase (H+-translocating)
MVKTKVSAMPSIECSNHAAVVILGAGYAGLMAALGLSRRVSGRVVLINEREEFVERIRLQESIAREVAERLPSLPAFLAGTGIEFMRGRVLSLDAGSLRVVVDHGKDVSEITFDRCIYALGSTTDVDAVPGASEHAYRLDPGPGKRSAAALRAKLRGEAREGLSVVVVGGANTATEVAGEIKATWPEVEVTIVSTSEAGDFGKGRKLALATRQQLQQLGVRWIDRQPVTEVHLTEVIIDGGEAIPADICVWAAGVRASPVADAAGLAVDRQGRVLADSMLSSLSHPQIMPVGDALHPVAPTGARYRMSAFGAIISGAYAASRLAGEANGREPRPFSFSAYGQGVSIGNGGVGFFTFPDDGDAYFILRGRLALRIRNLFVRILVVFLKLERRWPGSALFWIGRRRVSWQQARAALPGHNWAQARTEKQN